MLDSNNSEVHNTKGTGGLSLCLIYFLQPLKVYEPWF